MMIIFYSVVAVFVALLVVAWAVGAADHFALVIAFGLVAALFLLRASRQRRTPNANKYLNGRPFAIVLSDASQFLMVGAVLAYVLAVHAVLRPRLNGFEGRWSWILNRADELLGPFGVPAVFFSLGTFLLYKALKLRKPVN